MEPMLRFKADDGSEFPAWEEKTLGEVFTEIKEKNRSELPVLSVQQGAGTVLRDSSERRIAYNKNSLNNYKAMRKGDFIIHLRSFEGGLECSNHDGISSPAYHILRSNMILSDAFKDYFRSYAFIKGKLSDAVVGIRDGKNIDMPTFWEIQMSIPSLPEQRKIADFLSAVDAVIAAQQAEVDAWEQRKKGVMQKLFRQQVRLKADDGSDFPDWEEKTLGELCSPLTYGMNAAATKFDGENRYIRITDIDDETHALLPNDIVSPSGELDDKYLVKKGDILLARTGASTGKSYLYHQKDGKLFYAGFLIKAHVLPSSDDYFIYSQTLTDRYWKWVKTASMRSGQPGINANEYASYSFAVPSLPEQRKIADCLASMDEVIQKSKDELAKWQELKKGLLQQMFV